MKLAISANLFKNFPLYDAFKIVKSIGYDGIELLTDIPHFYPPQTTVVDLFNTLELLQRLDLKVSNINAFMFFAMGNSHYPSYFDNRFRSDFTKWSIFTANILGSETISIEPAGIKKNDFSSDLDNFVKVLSELAVYAKLYKVRVLIEPEPQLLIENVDETVRLMLSVNSKMDTINFLGVNADLGHFYCVGESFENVFDKLGQYIYHIHLEDINRDKKHFHLVPGDGVIDFHEILYWLNKINYSRWITVELYPFQDEPIASAQRAFNYLKKVGF